MIVFLAAVYLDEFKIVAIIALAYIAFFACFELFKTAKDDGFFLLQHDIPSVIL